MDSNPVRSLIPSDFNTSTTVPRFTRWISGTVFAYYQPIWYINECFPRSYTTGSASALVDGSARTLRKRT